MARPATGTLSPWLFIWLIVGIFSVQVLYAIVVFLVFGESGSPMAERGQFGDIFGGATAFFTGAALAGIVFTILLQRGALEMQQTELGLQREELQLTRAQLERAAEAQIEQVEALKDSANLRAQTALMNAYGAQLAPYWAMRLSLSLEFEGCSRDVDVAERKLTGQRQGSFEYAESDKHVQKLKENRDSVIAKISDLEEAWRHDVGKQGDLLTRLENLVEQTQQVRPT
jgi:uncharacterized membrane protein